MELRTDYTNVSFQNNGKLKLLIIVGTRPEIIRLAAVINKTRQYFDVILAHTGQNYDYNLNGVFFKDLKIKDPEVYMDAVGDDLGATCGNIINASYKLMVATKPDAVLVLGDGHDTISSKAGDGAAPDNDVDLFRVIARNFDAFSHDELRSILTRSGWPAVRP